MKTILLIEDCVDFLENLTEYLELEGFHVITANSGIKGIKLAIQHKPDLILCDFFMPVMNGREVKHLLLTTRSTALIPFILSTSITLHAKSKPVVRFTSLCSIAKPFELESLLQLIKNKLSLRSTTSCFPLYNLNFKNRLHQLHLPTATMF